MFTKYYCKVHQILGSCAQSQYVVRPSLSLQAEAVIILTLRNTRASVGWQSQPTGWGVRRVLTSTTGSQPTAWKCSMKFDTYEHHRTLLVENNATF